MSIQIILTIITIIFLFLIYKKLGNLRDFFDIKNSNEEDLQNEQSEKNINFQTWLYEKLKILEDKLTELSDVGTVENPAWGENSASSLKKKNLIKLYSQYLIDKEKLSQKDAVVKAHFVVNNFEGSLSDDINRDLKFHTKVKFEEDLILSDFFKEEVREKISTLKTKDIFEPLWIGIKIKKYKKGDELLQNTRKAFESHSAQYGYWEYVEDFAIISKLEELKIFERKKEKDEDRKTMSGHSFYILKEDNIEKIRKIIFEWDEENSAYYTDTYFDDKHWKDRSIKLPFKTPFGL